MYSSTDEKLIVLPFHTTGPNCDHKFLRQTKYPTLPALYIEIKPENALASHLPLQTISYLQHSLEFLGAMKPRSEGIGHDITALKSELEEGMSRDRREQMRLFVMGLKDERQRRAAEVYLARYPGFVLDGEGKLDYGVGDRFLAVEGGVNRKERVV